MASTLRQNIGALTTAFTAPTACSSYILYSDEFSITGVSTETWLLTEHVSIFGIYDACGTMMSASCLPHVTDYQDIIGGGFFYSPGIVCPVGFTSVLEVPSPTGEDAAAVTTNVQGVAVDTMLVDETVTICCPSGYDYSFTTAASSVTGYCQSDIAAQPQCDHDPDGSPTSCLVNVDEAPPFLSCDGGSLATLYMDGFGTTLNSTTVHTYTDGEDGAVGYETDITLLTPVVSGLSIRAPTIQLNYQNAAAISTTSSTNFASPFPSSSSTSSSPSSSSTSHSTSGARSLSTGAIAGIVVGAVVLLAIAGAFGFMIRSRRRRLAPPTESHGMDNEHEIQNFKGKPELQGTNIGSIVAKAELGEESAVMSQQWQDVRVLNQGVPVEMYGNVEPSEAP